MSVFLLSLKNLEVFLRLTYCSIESKYLNKSFYVALIKNCSKRWDGSVKITM